MSIAIEHDTKVLKDVPFGRNRFLGMLGGALSALAVRAVMPKAALAAHGAVPSPCFGYGVCHCCSGAICCESRCSWPADHSHCPGGQQCWYVCSGLYKYQCCDWHCGTCNNGHCICRYQVGLCADG